MLKRGILLLLLTISFLSASPVSAQASGPIYIVQPGDNLSSIAERFNIDLGDLMQANNISNANQLYAGQELVIPGLEGVSGVLQTEVINFGDSYRSLMRRTQAPEPLMRKLNRITSPSEFYVGVSMILPAQDNESALNARVAQANGESLLETAVRHKTDVWTLAHDNFLSGSWDGIPGDTLYTLGTDTQGTMSGLPSAFVSAEIRDLPLRQGGTGVIKVKAISGVTLGGLLVDHQLHFFPIEDGTQVALQGVHALLEPGVYPLRIDATLPDGSTQSYEQSVLVQSGNYPEDPLLYVNPTLIDPAVTDPENLQVAAITAPVTPTRYWTDIFKSPAMLYAETTYPTSRFGNRRIYVGQGTDRKVPWWHTGIDFAGGDGLSITAPAPGQVVFAGPLTVRGNATIIDHGWGVYSGIWHQSKINVQVGEMVQAGQVIGEVGSTGRVTGAHLHWEIWVNGVQVDPVDWLSQVYP